jgi:hypothetical protein
MKAVCCDLTPLIVEDSYDRWEFDMKVDFLDNSAYETLSSVEGDEGGWFVLKFFQVARLEDRTLYLIMAKRQFITPFLSEI